MTEMTNNATTGDGMFRNNIPVILNSRLNQPEFDLLIKNFSLVLFSYAKDLEAELRR